MASNEQKMREALMYIDKLLYASPDGGLHIMPEHVEDVRRVIKSALAAPPPDNARYWVVRNLDAAANMLRDAAFIAAEKDLDGIQALVERAAAAVKAASYIVQKKDVCSQ